MSWSWFFLQLSAFISSILKAKGSLVPNNIPELHGFTGSVTHPTETWLLEAKASIDGQFFLFLWLNKISFFLNLLTDVIHHRGPCSRSHLLKQHSPSFLLGDHDYHITQHQSPFTCDIIIRTRKREKISKHDLVSNQTCILGRTKCFAL